MGRHITLRKLLLLVCLTTFAFAAQAGCGDVGPGSNFDTGGGDQDGAIGPGPGPFGPGGDSDGSTLPGDADPDALGQLTVTPATATITVTIANGVVTSTPVQFTASYQGANVAATWLFDRGELGDVSTTGLFTANGKNVGEGTLTARYGAREGTAKVKVVIAATQNGNGDGDAGAGAGGQGGVGGEPLGPAIDPTIVNKLKTQSNAPANAQELGFLYPYDKTVWPRGLLPPLLMWQTTHEADAVYVKLSQSNYSFEGTYSVAQHPAASAARKRSRIEESPWRIATSGKQGDDLVLEVKIYSSAEDKVIGPITRTWKVAPGILKGTVYYNSYDSQVTSGGGPDNGGVIAIKPRSPNPVLAIPQRAGQCHVCHVVSSDGSTLYVQDGKVVYPNGADDYRNGSSYDLTKTPATEIKYLGASVAAHNRKFVWSAPYPDGSFALASSRFAREAYTQTDAKLFARADGSEMVPTTGLSGVVKSAVTPSFSPDGRKVTFNFWEGAGAGGVTAGAGRSLAILDFDCGAAAGSTKCAATPTYAFSNLREIYKDATRWPGWPSFLPDAKAVVFHNTIKGGDVGSGTECRADTVNPNSILNCQLTTWFGAQAEIWIAKDAATQDARRLDALNGFASGASYLPTSGSHPDDTRLNYNPTVNPVASGGYYWVVFTSRRLYGNLLTADPYSGSGQKKLWVAAIDINNPAAGADPSHPAFYLPGQELDAGNTRGFWVVDPCKPNGTSCETGDECCNGFCRKDPDGGALVCQDKPPGNPCSQEFEKCTVDADCCDPKFKCIAGKCARPDPVIK